MHYAKNTNNKENTMAQKLTQEQLEANFGAFIHEGLFLKAIEDIKGTIGVPDVSSVNGKTGVVVLEAKDIKTTDGKTVEASFAGLASAEDVSKLTTTVNGKAGQAQVDSLQELVGTKADKADLGAYLKTADFANVQAFKDLADRVTAAEARIKALEDAGKQ